MIHEPAEGNSNHLSMNQLKAVTVMIPRYYHSATLLSSSPPILLHLLHLSLAHRSLSLTHQCHAQILSLGLAQNPFLATKLITSYATCRLTTRSQLVFNSLQDKNEHLWNSLITGYVKNNAYGDAIALFHEMCSHGFSPDDYTLSTMSKLCGETKDLKSGELVHGRSIKNGFFWDVVVASSFMAMYVKCGEIGACLKLFDEMPARNVTSWNVVIAGYAGLKNASLDREMLFFIKRMQLEGLEPDVFTVSSLLTLCGEGSEVWDYGKEIHGYLMRKELGFGVDVHLGCCLIDMYTRSNRVDVARRVFDLMWTRNVYTWTAMINGYVKNGEMENALALFLNMQDSDGVEPNSVSLVSVLPAYSFIGGTIGGKQIHGYAIRKELNNDVSLRNALIDTYAKCGTLDYARRVFEDFSIGRDAISWSSMISGYGTHGKGEEAVLLYNEMLQLGGKPDLITLVGVLSACGRSRLVDEGLHIYNSAIKKYGIKPTVEICACVVDMLSRSGQLDQALDFIRTMPVTPGPSVWGALVSAAILQGNSEMQELGYRSLILLEPDDPSNYISLSNLHASSKRWDVVTKVRTMMKEKGLSKTPGCSWISVSNATHYFYASDKSHPCSELIHEQLDGLILLMKGAAALSCYDIED